jgi:hypothetical protein
VNIKYILCFIFIIFFIHESFVTIIEYITKPEVMSVSGSTEERKYQFSLSQGFDQI